MNINDGHDRYQRVTVCLPATLAEAAGTVATKRFCSLRQVYRGALVSDLRKAGALPDKA
jgi:hypothetical protein